MPPARRVRRRCLRSRSATAARCAPLRIVCAPALAGSNRRSASRPTATVRIVHDPAPNLHVVGQPGARCINGGCVQGAQCNSQQYCICPIAVRDGRCTTSNSNRPPIVQSVPPGSWCGADVQCYGGAQCHQNMCTCPYGQVISALQCVAAPIGSHALTRSR